MYGEEWEAKLKLFRGSLDGSLQVEFARQTCSVMDWPIHDKLDKDEIQALVARTGSDLLRWINGATLDTLPALTLMGIFDGLKEAADSLVEANQVLETLHQVVQIVSTQ